MAELQFTDTALLHIRAVIATSPMVEPVLSVVWSKGVVDSSRAPDGKVVWRTTEAPSWFAFISDWDEHRDLPVPRDELKKIDGIDVYFDKQAKEATGHFLLTLTEHGLAVDHAIT